MYSKYPITIQPGATPAPHELATMQILATVAPVVVLAPRRATGMRTPDIHWQGKNWEIKSPKGKGRDLIHNTIHRAVKQSPNIIIDLQRSQIYELTAIHTHPSYFISTPHSPASQSYHQGQKNY